jgi:cold-inducible RNA-binding protein
METKLYVGNMSYDMTESDLRTMFSEAGTVDAVDMIKDRDTGRPKGFAFVTMSNQAEAEKAISMFNEKMFNQRALTVNMARRAKNARIGAVVVMAIAAVEAGAVVQTGAIKLIQ